MTLGEKLKKARAEKGMSQSQVSGSFITRNMLSQLEHDQASPSLKTLEYLSSVLDVPISWLVSEDEIIREREQLREARHLFTSGCYSECTARLSAAKSLSQEERFLLCRSAIAAGESNFQAGHVEKAQELAQTSMEAAASCIYCGPWERCQASLLQVKCLVALQQNPDAACEAFEAQYRKLHLDETNAMLQAIVNLHRDADKAEALLARIPAEAGSLSGTEVLLKGTLLVQQSKYFEALSLFQEAEQNAAFPKGYQMELYRLMELCYKETENYRMAYHYASLRLQKA